MVTPEKLAEVEAKLRETRAWMQEKGIPLSKFFMGLKRTPTGYVENVKGTRGCCPLGGLILRVCPQDTRYPMTVAAGALDLSLKDTWAVAWGFDDTPSFLEGDPALFDLGRRLAVEWL